MIYEEEDHLAHYGTLRKSGRYPYGSGGNPSQSNKTFLETVADLKRQGLSDAEIYGRMDMTSTEFRAKKSIAKNEQKQADISMAQRLKEKGYSNGAVGERMAINGVPRNESSIRSLLAAGEKDKADILFSTASMLKKEVDSKKFVDVGTGVENHIGVSKDKLGTALAVLKDDGYVVEKVQVDQLGTAPGNKTTVKVLAPPGTVYRDIAANADAIRQIQQIEQMSDDGGRNFYGLQYPMSIDSGRVGIRYAEDGGNTADGVMYIRPGVDDVSLGGSRYAQVRVAVDGTHYIKGMAMYKDDLPAGIDIQFNTNKSSTGNKLDALKTLADEQGRIDVDNPFGARISRQITTLNPDGTRTVTSAMNIVNDQGRWNEWSRNLSSQTLSKQSPVLAKSQLNMTYERKKGDLDEILSLTNPTVRKKLLETFADEVDSSAVHLKAAALPRSFWHAILPFNDLKETEIYAPNFNDGERVALIRYPHGGTFEIPELIVNNSSPSIKSAIGLAKDAVGINSKVAARLSGADFDGDAVMVIPNNSNNIKTTAPLAGLKNFDPQSAYPGYPGMTKMTSSVKGQQMGDISNLITDMTIQRASTSELAQALRHSMVVIDAEKHGLNYKESARANGVAALKVKYQGKANAGASTLISRATARTEVLARRPRPAAQGGFVDRATGKKVYEYTNKSYEKSTTNKRTGVTTTKTIYNTQRSRKLVEADDANTLSSGTLIERVYADHSNKLKAMANTARKEAVNTTPVRYSPSAKAAYSKEVGRLDAALNIALKNRPLERQAQVLANAVVKQKRVDNPNMDKESRKKIEAQALAEQRTRTGAKKQQIIISDTEWSAIQAGAITTSKLTEILKNADLNVVKQLATPKTTPTKLLMTSTKLTRAKAMAASGYTQAEIAGALGVSLTTLKDGLA